MIKQLNPKSLNKNILIPELCHSNKSTLKINDEKMSMNQNDSLIKEKSKKLEEIFKYT